MGAAGGNSVAYCSDGITWTGLGIHPFPLGGVGNGYHVGFGYSNNTGVFVATGTNTGLVGGNTLAYSTDGVTWTGLGYSVFLNYARKVTYSITNKIWMVGGNGSNVFAYSTNAVTWTSMPQLASVFTGYGQQAMYNN
jgi:hypothetical protein